MRLTPFVLNIPYTSTAIIPLLLSGPYNFRFVKDPITLVFRVRSFWWAFGYLKNARAMTIGHIILLSPKELKKDFEHEIIHVKQCERQPLIHPFLYLYELIKYGYRNNKFEDKAYRVSKSIYKGKKN